MYIFFDEYSRYSGRISEIKEFLNGNIQCNHGYAYYSDRKNCAHGLMRLVGKL